LRAWTGKNVAHLYHGFDHDTFLGAHPPLPPDLQARLDSGQGAVRLLLVSHYNYYRNFETLLRALPVLRERLAGRRIELVLTCSLRSPESSGGYRRNQATRLIRELGIEENLVELGVVPHAFLPAIYRACNLYVTPAYAESFAHPLVEAMASELPIVASDLPVHREICGRSALYFDTFSPEDLARKVLAVTEDPALGRELSCSGAARSRNFSWQEHVQILITQAIALREQRR